MPTLLKIFCSNFLFPIKKEKLYLYRGRFETLKAADSVSLPLTLMIRVILNHVFTRRFPVTYKPNQVRKRREDSTKRRSDEAKQCCAFCAKAPFNPFFRRPYKQMSTEYKLSNLFHLIPLGLAGYDMGIHTQQITLKRNQVHN